MPILTKEVTRTTEIMCGFKCDKCGAEYSTDNAVEWQEVFYWQTVGGYGSVWGDGANVEITLCQRCAKDVLGELVRIS